jgi:hypothetical protein
MARKLKAKQKIIAILKAKDWQLSVFDAVLDPTMPLCNTPQRMALKIIPWQPSSVVLNEDWQSRVPWL